MDIQDCDYVMGILFIFIEQPLVYFGYFYFFQYLLVLCFYLLVIYFCKYVLGLSFFVLLVLSFVFLFFCVLFCLRVLVVLFCIQQLLSFGFLFLFWWSWFCFCFGVCFCFLFCFVILNLLTLISMVSQFACTGGFLLALLLYSLCDCFLVLSSHNEDIVEFWCESEMLICIYFH